MQETLYLGLGIKEWVVVAATLLGPILAVQAQKAVEAFRETRQRKAALFEQLMATRASRVSAEHVRGLNMIDLVFYGKRSFGVSRRTASEQNILDCWKEYLDHLNSKVDEKEITLWVAKGDELFTNLLFAISKDLDFTFDRVQLKRGTYMPRAHGEFEEEQTELRKATLSLITGKHALKMNVVGFPVDTEAVESNKAVIQSIGKAFQTGVLQVDLTPKD